MKKGNLKNWEDTSSCNNLLLFSQLGNELLFNYSIPSNRIATLNSHYLCYDAIETINSIENKGTPDATLKPIAEELLVEIRKDPLFGVDNDPAKYFVKYKDGKYSLNTNVDNLNYHDIKNAILSINQVFFSGGKYYKRLKKRIVEIIEKNDASEQKELFRLTKSLLTELVNSGYSIRYLYSVMNSIFWNPRSPICQPNDISRFFKAFDFKPTEYQVVFKVDYEKIDKFVSRIDDLECYDELPEDLSEKVDSEFLRLSKKEKFLILKARALDPYGAAYKAISIVDINSSVYRLYDHSFRYSVKDTDCRIIGEIAYKMPQEVQAMEHTRIPSIRSIEKSLRAVDDVIQRVTTSQRYGDFLAIINATRLHTHSLESRAEENQLLDLWAIFETVLDVSNKHTRDRIEQVCMFIVPILKRQYIFTLFRQLADDIKNYDEDLFNSIVGNETDDFKIVQAVCEFCLLDSFKMKRDKVLHSIEDFPLLKERIEYYSEKMNSRQAVFEFVEKHARRVRWQIMRIYRNRNLIIHNGERMSYLSLLIENLHSYVDDFLTYTIDSLACDKTIESMCQELFVKECDWQEAFQRHKMPLDSDSIRKMLMA